MDFKAAIASLEHGLNGLEQLASRYIESVSRESLTETVRLNQVWVNWN